jgi:hypothetical protein
MNIVIKKGEEPPSNLCWILGRGIASRPPLGPTRPPYVGGAGGSFSGSKAEHSPPSSAEIKNGGAIPPIPPYVFMIRYLIKHYGNLSILQLLHYACGRYIHIGYWWESQKERDHWENQDVGGWTMLTRILER